MSPAREFARLRALQRLLRLYEVTYGPVCGISFLRRHVVEKMCRLAKLMPLVLVLLSTGAMAQEHHAQHHAHYQNWINQDDKGCCNDQDCGELKDQDERTDGGKLSVKIDGEWCPVLPQHYLKRGNAPDGSVSHVCVQKKYDGNNQTACERLLCYQPKPGI